MLVLVYMEGVQGYMLILMLNVVKEGLIDVIIQVKEEEQQ